MDYLTDSGLSAKAVARIGTTVRRIQAAGGALRTRLRDRSRAAGSRAGRSRPSLRLRTAAGRDDAQAALRRITGELASLAEDAATEADHLLANARRVLRPATAHAAERAAAGLTDAAVERRRRPRSGVMP